MVAFLFYLVEEGGWVSRPDLDSGAGRSDVDDGSADDLRFESIIDEWFSAIITTIVNLPSTLIRIIPIIPHDQHLHNRRQRLIPFTLAKIKVNPIIHKIMRNSITTLQYKRYIKNGWNMIGVVGEGKVCEESKGGDVYLEGGEAE